MADYAEGRPEDEHDDDAPAPVVASYLVRVTCRNAAGWVPATLTNSQVEVLVNEAVARATGLQVRSHAERTDR